MLHVLIYVHYHGQYNSKGWFWFQFLFFSTLPVTGTIPTMTAIDSGVDTRVVTDTCKYIPDKQWRVIYTFMWLKHLPLLLILLRCIQNDEEFINETEGFLTNKSNTNKLSILATNKYFREKEKFQINCGSTYIKHEFNSFSIRLWVYSVEHTLVWFVLI